MDVRLANDQHIEVHRFHTGVVTGMVILALMLEAFLRSICAGWSTWIFRC